jgi:hypothetical protein
MKTFLIGLGVAAYLVVGFYVWLTSALAMIGADRQSYLGKLKSFSDGGTFQEVLSFIYTFGLWPIHLIMGWSLKK